MTDDEILRAIAEWRKTTMLRDCVNSIVLVAQIEDELMKRRAEREAAARQVDTLALDSICC